MEEERGGEKHQCMAASWVLPTGDPAHNPGMCPDWESNQRPFGLQAGTQSTEPHQSGHVFVSNMNAINVIGATSLHMFRITSSA